MILPVIHANVKKVDWDFWRKHTFMLRIHRGLLVNPEQSDSSSSTCDIV